MWTSQFGLSHLACLVICLPLVLGQTACDRKPDAAPQKTPTEAEVKTPPSAKKSHDEPAAQADASAQPTAPKPDASGEASTDASAKADEVVKQAPTPFVEKMIAHMVQGWGAQVQTAQPKGGPLVIVGAAGLSTDKLRVVAVKNDKILDQHTYRRWPGVEKSDYDPKKQCQIVHVGVWNEPSNLLLVKEFCSTEDNPSRDIDWVEVFRPVPSWKGFKKLEPIWFGRGDTDQYDADTDCRHGLATKFAYRPDGELWVERTPVSENPNHKETAFCKAKPPKGRNEKVWAAK